MVEFTFRLRAERALASGMLGERWLFVEATWIDCSEEHDVRFRLEWG